MQLSDHFTLEELTNSPTAQRLKIKNSPSTQELRNLQILCQQVLEPARNIVAQPLFVSSGYRCKMLNKAVGGASNSYHIQGRAADITITNDDETEKLNYARKLADALNKQPLCDLVLVEHDHNSTWVHVQWSTKPRHHINYNYRPHPNK